MIEQPPEEARVESAAILGDQPASVTAADESPPPRTAGFPQPVIGGCECPGSHADQLAAGVPGEAGQPPVGGHHPATGDDKGRTADQSHEIVVFPVWHMTTRRSLDASRPPTAPGRLVRPCHRLDLVEGDPALGQSGHHRFRPGRGTKLCQHVLEVGLHRAFPDTQPGCHLLIG